MSWKAWLSSLLWGFVRYCIHVEGTVVCLPCSSSISASYLIWLHMLSFLRDTNDANLIKGRNLSLWAQCMAGRCCPERLLNLYAWRFSRPDWPRCRVPRLWFIVEPAWNKSLGWVTSWGPFLSEWMLRSRLKGMQTGTFHFMVTSHFEVVQC